MPRQMGPSEWVNFYSGKQISSPNIRCEWNPHGDRGEGQAGSISRVVNQWRNLTSFPTHSHPVPNLITVSDYKSGITIEQPFWMNDIKPKTWRSGADLQSDGPLAFLSCKLQAAKKLASSDGFIPSAGDASFEGSVWGQYRSVQNKGPESE